MKKDKVLIVFYLSNLAYSPTTLNLYDALEPHFDVLIIAPSAAAATHLPGRRRVEYVSIPHWLRRIAASLDYRLKKYCGLGLHLIRWLDALFFARAVRRHPCQTAIGADFQGMWIVQRAFGHGHMLSLEIEPDDPFQKRVNLGRIDSLIIQTQARYDHLFEGVKIPYFLVQNAPVYRAPACPVAPCETVTELIYCGSTMPGFGIFRCLDFLVQYPEFRLTIQGDVSPFVLARIERDYPVLLADNRLSINREYLIGQDLFDYLAGFAVGFCCYDLGVPGMDNFNYRSAPSGKLFSYYAAGVPVVGSDLPGLYSVHEFGTGVLIAEFTPSAIREAIATIIQSRVIMSTNCRRAAQHFSFDKAVAPFVESLTKTLAGRLAT